MSNTISTEGLKALAQALKEAKPVITDADSLARAAAGITKGGKVIYRITPLADCKFCHGRGIVTEYHPYGNTVPDLLCDCVVEQLPKEFDDFKDGVEVIDNGWQGADNPEFEYDD